MNRRELFVLTQDNDTQVQWLPITLDIKHEDYHCSDIHLPVIDNNFPALQKIVLSNNPEGKTYFISKFNRTISLLSISSLKEQLRECEFPDDFENREQLAALLANQKTLCKASAHVREIPVFIHGEAQDMSKRRDEVGHFFKTLNKGNHQSAFELLVDSVSPPKNEIHTVRELLSFARAEIKRLDSRWVWNGRAKAQAIRNALDKLNDVNWLCDESMQDSPAIAARTSGLIDALAIHRHTFFNHTNKAKSHESLFKRCSSIQSGM